MGLDAIRKSARGASRRTLDGVGDFSTLIGHDSLLSGMLKGSDNCIFNGTMDGGCALDGALVVGDGALWKGDIEAATVVVCGQVQGNITAREKVELTSTARVTGSITGPALAMAEGAVHQGEIHMARASDVLHFKEKRRSGEGSAPGGGDM